jgi:predicted DNA-binding transcriptional regulator AlpA
MAWFSVSVEARRPSGDPREVDEDQLDSFVDAVARHDGVVGGGADVWDSRISVETEDADQACLRGVEVMRTLAVKAGLPDWPLVRVEATRQDVLDEQNTRPNYPELVSGPEAAELLGVSRQRLWRLAREHAGFPAPLYRLRVGPLWIRSGIEAFAQRWERRPGRPRKTA